MPKAKLKNCIITFVVAAAVIFVTSTIVFCKTEPPCGILYEGISAAASNTNTDISPHQRIARPPDGVLPDIFAAILNIPDAVMNTFEPDAGIKIINLLALSVFFSFYLALIAPAFLNRLRRAWKIFGKRLPVLAISIGGNSPPLHSPVFKGISVFSDSLL